MATKKKRSVKRADPGSVPSCHASGRERRNNKPPCKDCKSDHDEVKEIVKLYETMSKPLIDSMTALIERGIASQERIAAALERAATALETAATADAVDGRSIDR